MKGKNRVDTHPKNLKINKAELSVPPLIPNKTLRFSFMETKIRVKKAFTKHLRSFCKLFFLVLLHKSYSFASEIMISSFHFIHLNTLLS